MPAIFELDTDAKIERLIHVLRNFLNYLLHHDVCPEYKDQINAARRTCDLAEVQLPLIREASSLIPGAFNRACSTIFGGSYKDSYLGDNEEAMQMGCAPGLSPTEALKIFAGGMAAYAEISQVQTYNQAIKVRKSPHVQTTRSYIEVKSIHFSDREVRALYAHQSMSGLETLGKLNAVSWHCPASSPEDLTEEEEAHIAKNGRPIKEYQFWMEDSLLEKLFVGLKLEVDIHELSFGVWYFDLVTAMLCSFYEDIPNEWMIGWKDHRYIPPRDSIYKEGEREVRVAIGKGDGVPLSRVKVEDSDLD